MKSPQAANRVVGGVGHGGGAAGRAVGAELQLVAIIFIGLFG